MLPVLDRNDAVGSRAPVVSALRRVLPRATVLRMVARRHGLHR